MEKGDYISIGAYDADYYAVIDSIDEGGINVSAFRSKKSDGEMLYGGRFVFSQVSYIRKVSKRTAVKRVENY